MPWPDDIISGLVKDERPTLLEAEKGNELIDALNALANITIQKGRDDEVTYAEDGVTITYGPGFDFIFSGSVKVIDANDLTQLYVITFDKGSLVSVTTESSGWEEKSIVICEDGSEATYTFLVKS